MNPFSYNFFFNQAMLALVISTGLIYLSSQAKRNNQDSFNATGIVLLPLVLILFIGLRPISGAFIDMVTYAQKYNFAASGMTVYEGDPAFSAIMQNMAPYFGVEYFFFVCAILYILPLALAAKIAHGRWAFACFLCFSGSFSFFAYGVNGIRNGIATSVAILAFSCYRKAAFFYPLAILAGLFHKSVYVTVGFFLITRFVNKPIFYVAGWVACLIGSLVLRESAGIWITSFMPVSDEGKLEGYLYGQGADRGGFRGDFILYSIVPVIISHFLAVKEGRTAPLYRRLLCTYLATNAFWLLCMYVAYSNRFAYLSWCILPWVIICPHLLSTKKDGLPSTPVLLPSSIVVALVLWAHFMFTYVMNMFYYR